MAAPIGNKNAVGNDGGQPTSYEEVYNDLAYKYCLLGATDKQLADFFEVCEATINNWKKEHIEFLVSIRAGKEIADMEVAEKFIENAKGFRAKNIKAIKLRVWDKDAEKMVEIVKMVQEETQYPPNTPAGIFWLKNRQPERWKDKTETDITTKGDSINASYYSKLSVSALKEIAKLDDKTESE